MHRMDLHAQQEKINMPAAADRNTGGPAVFPAKILYSKCNPRILLGRVGECTTSHLG